jgi:hypothetical protein
MGLISPPREYYRHPGVLQGLQTPRIPTVPNPNQVFSPERQVQSTLARLSEAKVPTNLLQRVQARLQDWAKAEAATPTKVPLQSSAAMTIAVKELAVLDPGLVLTNRESLGAVTLGSVAVAKIAAYELGARGRLKEVTESLLAHPPTVSLNCLSSSMKRIQQ